MIAAPPVPDGCMTSQEIGGILYAIRERAWDLDADHIGVTVMRSADTGMPPIVLRVRRRDGAIVGSLPLGYAKGGEDTEDDLPRAVRAAVTATVQRVFGRAA